MNMEMIRYTILYKVSDHLGLFKRAHGRFVLVISDFMCDNNWVSWGWSILFICPEPIVVLCSMKVWNWFFFLHNKGCFISQVELPAAAFVCVCVCEWACARACGCMCVCVMEILGEGMRPSRDSPVLMIPSLVRLWQPGPDVSQVGRTRASVRERNKRSHLYREGSQESC